MNKVHNIDNHYFAVNVNKAQDHFKDIRHNFPVQAKHLGAMVQLWGICIPISALLRMHPLNQMQPQGRTIQLFFHPPSSRS